MSADQERALRLGLDRTRREMLAGQDDPLSKVEVERSLELEVVHIGRCARVPLDSAEAYVERLRRG